MRSHYWTCSAFADWLRGTPKLDMGTSEEWEEWEVKARSFSAFRYWLADDALTFCERVFYWPTDKINDIKYYYNNRWVTHTHALTAHPRDLKPGQWADVGNRFLPCLFNELQDFVEVELAWWHLAWDEKNRAKYNAPRSAFGWARTRGWRCPQAGLDNLEWQRNLRWNKDEVSEDSENLGKLTPQAENAQEILDLYNWWTQTYRNRPEPMEASGWTAYCEAARLANGGKLSFSSDKTPELKKMSTVAMKRLHKMEADYEKEDEQMMIRLIKVRHGLWT